MSFIKCHNPNKLYTDFILYNNETYQGVQGEVQRPQQHGEDSWTNGKQSPRIALE